VFIAGPGLIETNRNYTEWTEGHACRRDTSDPSKDDIDFRKSRQTKGPCFNLERAKRSA